MTPERQAKQMIVVRTDLNMRRGKMVAQGAHACLGSFTLARQVIDGVRGGPGYNIDHSEWEGALYSWIVSGETKVCVRVDSEEELMRVHAAATKAGLPVHLVTDAGHTEFHGVPTRTCLAIGPCWAEEVDRITGELRLL